MNSKEKIAMLQFIIEEYESAAMKKASRQSVIMTLNGPLSAMSRMTESAKSVTDEGISEYNIDQSQDSDLSLLEMYNGFGDTPVGSWIEECLNCDIRPLAPWQMSPLDFMGPIKDLMAQINQQLDNIDRTINDFGPISQICNLLNGLKGLTCPQDILIMIMSLNMLFKLRAGQLLKIRLDWTVMLGPLLSVIFDGVAKLLGWIETLVMNVLDCLINAIGTIGSIQQELGETVGMLNAYVGRDIQEDEVLKDGDKRPDNDVKTPSYTEGTKRDEAQIESINPNGAQPAASQRGLDSVIGIDINGTINGRDATLTAANDFVGVSDTEELEGYQEIKEENKENIFKSWPYNDPSFAFMTGAEADVSMTIDEAIQLPGWASASWSTQLIIALRTAKSDVQSLINNIKLSIFSLRKLVSGGLAAQIQATQTLLYLISLIKLLVAVFKLIKSMPDITDWCEEIEKNPSVISEYLGTQFPEYKFAAVEPSEDPELGFSTPGMIKVTNESAMVANIEGCSSRRNMKEAERLSQWISRLQNMGVV